MKKLNCDSCGDVNLIKDGDLYICQSCGSQYITEELYINKKQVNINVTINSKPGQAAQAARYLTLALKAYHVKDITEAGEYAQLVLELNTEVSMAWFLKGVNTGYSSTVSYSRCEEAIHYFEQALQYSNSQELEFLNEEIPEVMTKIVIAYTSLHKSRFIQDPSQFLMQQLLQCQEKIEGYDKLLQECCGLKLLEYRTEVIQLINIASCTAWNNALSKYDKCFGSDSKPNDSEVQTFLDQAQYSCELSRTIIKQPVENNEDNILYCNNLIISLKRLLSVNTYTRKWSSGNQYRSGHYYWASTPCFSHQEKEKIIDEIMQCHEKIKEYDPEYIIPERPKQSCYIATAVYGSYDCAQVWTLRRYRDQVLKNCLWGRIFIVVYYTISPKMLTLFGRNQLFLSWSKRWLDELVEQLQKRGFENMPYTDC